MVATGFIGSSLLKKLEKHYENILLVGQENKTINNKFLQCTPENLKIHLMGTEKEIYFYHLATHYSKDIKEKNKIFQANVTFGRKIVTELKKYNLVKNNIYQYDVHILSTDKRLFLYGYKKSI